MGVMLGSVDFPLFWPDLGVIRAGNDAALAELRRDLGIGFRRLQLELGQVPPANVPARDALRALESLAPGFYRLFWEGGGSSLAVIGAYPSCGGFVIPISLTSSPDAVAWGCVNRVKRIRRPVWD